VFFRVVLNRNHQARCTKTIVGSQDHVSLLMRVWNLIEYLGRILSGVGGAISVCRFSNNGYCSTRLRRSLHRAGCSVIRVRARSLQREPLGLVALIHRFPNHDNSHDRLSASTRNSCKRSWSSSTSASTETFWHRPSQTHQ